LISGSILAWNWIQKYLVMWETVPSSFSSFPLLFQVTGTLRWVLWSGNQRGCRRRICIRTWGQVDFFFFFW
jgi:hypothetical protein